MSDRELSEIVRERVMEGDDVVDVAKLILSQLGDPPAFFPFAHAFFRGLNVPVQVLYEMVGWNGIGGSGDVSDEDLRTVLQPYADRLLTGE
ncbi:hypothetical protein ACFY15_31155 [Streptomyces sp. NPDC001373]|uniref:hypothetical protein n=1 Tax=Streptomyces sp. NPDC001373 TaxID=3364565 RepID=UPI003698679F